MVRVLGQMATLVVLARLLPPAAFGLLAMVAAIGLVLDLVKEFGLSSATIQKSDITHAQVSALFWINAGVGTVLAVGLFLAAPLIANFYGQPELESIARWLSIGFRRQRPHRAALGAAAPADALRRHRRHGDRRRPRELRRGDRAGGDRRGLLGAGGAAPDPADW